MLQSWFWYDKLCLNTVYTFLNIAAAATGFEMFCVFFFFNLLEIIVIHCPVFQNWVPSLGEGVYYVHLHYFP